jgi:hypothetical protein
MEEENIYSQIKNMEIKADSLISSRYLNVLRKQKNLNIKCKNSNISINYSSIFKIFELNEESFLENILFIFETNNSDVLNNINKQKSLLLSPLDLSVKNILLNKKKEYLIPYIFLILGTIIFIHLLTFIFSQYFIVNIYLISCVAISEMFFTLGYFYYEKLNESECFNFHYQYVKPLHIYSICLILINLIIIFSPFFSGTNLNNFIHNHRINFIITYILICIPCLIATYYELYSLKDGEHTQFREITELGTIGI